ncbi:MAG: histidinol-phosphate transaminase, partial [Phycisphaerae bacterium]
MTYFRKNIEAMTGYTPGEQPQGDSGAVKLNTNENPYPPSPRVLEVLRRTDWSLLRKYPDPMANKVRDILARMHGVRRDNILCGNGSDELLGLAARAFCGERDSLAYPVPTYSLYPVLAWIQGAEPVEIERAPDFSLPGNLLDRAKGARMLIICSPNAPTGTWTPPEVLESLADQFKGVLAIDEAYVNFARGDAMRLAERYNVLVFRTLSKSYSLAGLRFGYVVGPEALILGLRKVKDSYNVDAISIELAAAALEDQAWMQANVEKIRSERARLSEGLARLGFAALPSEANFVLAAVPDGDAGRWHEALKARRILVRYWNRPR